MFNKIMFCSKLMSTLLTCVFYSNMYFLMMGSQVSFLCSLVVTQFAWVFYTHMDRLLMCSKNIFAKEFPPTLLTCKFHSDMISLFVFINTRLVKCFKITKFAGIFHFLCQYLLLSVLVVNTWHGTDRIGYYKLIFDYNKLLLMTIYKPKRNTCTWNLYSNNLNIF